MIKYNHKETEKKWQKFWEKNKTNFCDLSNKSKAKFYNLVMFFYPSGEKIHIGHGYNYTGSDVFGRYMRMRGKNVFEPMGYDAFGLPAENYAIKAGVHPAKSTRENIEFGKKQLKKMGLMYDWEKEINTSSPGYYKWTQWIFSLLYKAGLAYQAEAPVNWCPSCKTVLANEQVLNGRCERCESSVIQKNLKQWFFKITDYADRLLEDHKKLNWPEKTIIMQRNWIGRSEGAIIKFQISPDLAKRSGAGNSKFQINSKSQNPKQDYLEVFTTRPDTLFGATFMVVAPEHLLIENCKSQISNFKEVEKYIEKAKKKSNLERTDLAKEKTGVELKGIKAVNPVNNEEIPIFVADYVMMGYGTGAIMAVPAHDERDWEFAKKYGLEIREVIKGGNVEKAAFLEINKGEMVNSGEFNGLQPDKCIQKITTWLENKKLGKAAVNYKLRDWLISRQRYWGAPIPIIYCPKCGEVLDENLPVKLPELDNFKPTQEGESPLARSKEFVEVKCPKCKGKAKRSTETMDTFVCSSWYFLRFLSPHLKEAAFDKKLAKKWLPVDQYSGGAEHACGHLLYARFITKVLYDQGYINFDEPFTKLNHQGMILAEDGGKMSKSRGNVVIPDEYIQKYGADVFRMYILFLAPFERGGAWSDKGILGVSRFLNEVWNYIFSDYTGAFGNEEGRKGWINGGWEAPTPREIEILLNKTIKKVTEDIENFKFNTAISQLMILRNSFHEIEEVEEHVVGRVKVKVEPIKGKVIKKSDFEKFLIILAPFAPHLAEEIWHALDEKNRKDKSIFNEKWPAYDKDLIQDEEIELVIQVNGKVRDKIKVAADISEAQAKKMALESRKVNKWLEGKKPKKMIYIKGRLLSIVV